MLVEDTAYVHSLHELPVVFFWCQCRESERATSDCYAGKAAFVSTPVSTLPCGGRVRVEMGVKGALQLQLHCKHTFNCEAEEELGNVAKGFRRRHSDDSLAQAESSDTSHCADSLQV